MKLKQLSIIVALLSSVQLVLAQGTAFNYQGRLNDGVLPATGVYDLQFSLWNANAGPSQIDGTVTVNDLPITNGLFTVSLDFGAGAFEGSGRWLQVEARPGDSVGAYTVLPRTQILPSPYAIYAGTAATATTATTATSASTAAAVPWGGVSAKPAGFADGVDNDTTYSAGTGLSLGGTTFSLDTTYTDNRYWKRTGNAGTTPGTDFLGTTDNQPLEFKANGLRALRLEPNASGPNVVGGAANNTVAVGVYGATIAGGGNNTNSSGANYSTIGGGDGNTIKTDADHSTIGGGGAIGVGAGSYHSTIGGGWDNTIGTNSRQGTISGGRWNRIADNSGRSTIAGGQSNDIGTNSANSAIGGGNDNNIADNSPNATIAGGTNNNILSIADKSTIGGGNGNTIQENANHSTIGGGGVIGIGAGSVHSTIGGGWDNSIGTNSYDSTIGGGKWNRIADNSDSATIPGGQDNAATNFAFAAGRRAKAIHTGAFVWADSTYADFASSLNDQFSVRAAGGVRFETAGAGLRVDGLSVFAGTLPADSVSSGTILNGTITGADLANNTVTSAQLGDDVELGSISANGELTLWSDANNLESLRLYGATGTIDVYDNSGDRTLSLSGGGASGGAMTLWGPDGTLRANLNGSSSGASFLLRDAAATATVQLRGDLGGEIDAAQRFNVVSALGGTTFAQLEKHAGGAWLKTYDEAGLITGTFGSSGGAAGGFVELHTGANKVGLRLDGDDGGAGLIVINSTNGASRVTLDGYGSGGGGEIRLADTNASTRLSLFGQGANSAGEINVFDTSGTETIEVLGQQSSTLGSRITMRNALGTNTITLDAEYLSAGEGGAISFNNGAGNQRLRIEGDLNDAGYLVVYGTNGAAKVSLDGNYGNTGEGRVTTEHLQITSVTTSLTNTATLTPGSGFVRISGSGGAVTLNATTAITSGSGTGLILVLEGTSDVNTVTIPDNANTRLAASRTLGLNDTLTLIWNGSDWVELSFSNN